MFLRQKNLYHFTADEKVKWLWKEQAGGWSSYDEFGAIVFCLAGMYYCWRFVTRELSRFAVQDLLDFNCCVVPWWWSAWWSFVIGFVWSFGRRNRSISRRWHVQWTLIISTICGSAYHIFLVITITKFDLSTSWVWGTSDVWEQTWKSILKTDYVELNTFQVWFATNKGDLYFAHLHLCHHFVSIHYFSLNNFPVKFQ